METKFARLVTVVVVLAFRLDGIEVAVYERPNARFDNANEAVFDLTYGEAPPLEELQTRVGVLSAAGRYIDHQI
ncbi:hypothetical protein RQP46_010927 [Phenoliferia psychrophenolica]